MDLACLEIDDGVERERPGDPRHRVDVQVTDLTVRPEQLLDPGAVDLARLVRVRIIDSFPQARPALRVELDREILEAHGYRSSGIDDVNPAACGASTGRCGVPRSRASSARRSGSQS